ncbi:MAG: peptidase domain-containing ABC transporter, partial [Chitinophagaceae bacterium]|nr:peptidase domain-containing ABC transporter [Chitinophagaceae bacterium]
MDKQPSNNKKKKGRNWLDLFTRADRKPGKKVIIRQRDLTDCGAACLASVAAWYGLNFPVARIRQLASTDKQGTNLLGLVEAAKQLGLSARAVKADAESLLQLPLPAIAHVALPNGLHHYVVIYKANKDLITVMDPGSGVLQDLPSDNFYKLWTGILVLIAPLPEFEPGDHTQSPWSRLRMLLQPHRALLIQVMIGALFYTILGLSTSIFLQKILDNIIPDANQNLLNVLSMIMIGILLIQLFINYIRTLLTMQTGQQIDARLILGYYKHLLSLPQQFFDTMRTGEIISRMNDAVKIRAFINEALISLAVSVFILVFSFVLMFTSYWKLALIMLVVIPLYAVIYFISNKINRRTQRKLMEHNADLGAQLVESVNSIGTIKQFSLEEYANLKTENRFVKVLGSVYQSGVNSIRVNTATSFVSSLFVIILLWAGATFVLQRAITPGELLSFYALVGYFSGPAISLISLNRVMQDALIAFDRLFEIMDLQREEAANRMALEPSMVGDIRLKDVHFRYGARASVFEGLTLDIPAGKVTAIIGESGSGKTTLLALLQNLYPLQSGRVSIGEFDIRYLTPASLRTVLSVVPQKVDLFAGTVRENIAIGEYDPDMKKIIQVCKETGILEMIEGLPNGFDTMLGENGVNLSGGQRQRLAIARALYRDPEILILDEATASLDSAAEQKIQDALKQLQQQGKTIIIIAHRLS